jgi:hypothetical protein
MAAYDDIDPRPLRGADPARVWSDSFQAGRRLAAPAPASSPAAPDPPLVSHLARLDPAQRAAAAQAQEQLAAVLFGLRLQTRDVGQRLAMARHIAAQHPRFGIDPAAITPADVTDAGIAAHIAGARDIARRLAAAPSVKSNQGAARYLGPVN